MTVPLDLCLSKPYEYKLCNNRVCIKQGKLCPCLPDEEFRCSLGNCIPVRLRCDGLKQCMFGEDENGCSDISSHLTTETTTPSTTKVSVVRSAVKNAGTWSERRNSYTVTGETVPAGIARSTADQDVLSLPLIVIISSACVFLCVIGFIVGYLIIRRRNNRNTSKDSQSPTEPLRKSYIRADTDNVNVEDETQLNGYLDVHPPICCRQVTYYPAGGVQYETNETVCEDMGNGGVESGFSRRKVLENSEGGLLENHYIECQQNLAVKPGTEIYDIGDDRSTRVHGLGRYTFKPRLKYMKSIPFTEIEKKDREKLYVINSYKHCAGKSILPATLTFDKDPETFSNKFAADLLCSSTPRQPARHLVKPFDRSKSLDSLP